MPDERARRDRLQLIESHVLRPLMLRLAGEASAAGLRGKIVWTSGIDDECLRLIVTLTHAQTGASQTIEIGGGWSDGEIGRLFSNAFHQFVGYSLARVNDAGRAERQPAASESYKWN
jgi:hypothetical protein